jgi:hypothetical protein
MVADFFTKPLQGALFRRLRDAVLNIHPMDGPASLSASETKERVGDVGKYVRGRTDDGIGAEPQKNG